MNFSKYHGTGNDFILIDNRQANVDLLPNDIAKLCNRRFGIGADGLILLEVMEGYDFRMLYFNADGNESTMCGNGGRCVVSFAKKIGIIKDSARFYAIDGAHQATIENDGLVSLCMADVTEIAERGNALILDTGSPHYVIETDDIKMVDVYNQGRAIRNQMEFMPKGINVNFVKPMGDALFVRTYERGVEDETLSCGTGVVASAIAFSGNKNGSITRKIKTFGGALDVSFYKINQHLITNVILKGPAVNVFDGSID